MNHNNKSAVTVLRWAARLASLASLGFVLLLAIGEGFNPLKMTARDLALGVFFPFGIFAGMMLAWWRESWGGCITVASVFAFYVVHFAISGTLPRGPWLVIVASPGALFLLSRLLARRACEARN
jgi:hypothetical protein